MNLIEAQDEAIADLLALPEQGRRACSFGMSFLNRNPRSMRPIRVRFEKRASRMGFRPDQIKQQWEDVKDMAFLEARAE